MSADPAAGTPGSAVDGGGAPGAGIAPEVEAHDAVEPADRAAIEPTAVPTPRRPVTRRTRLHPAHVLTIAAALAFTALYAFLCVRHHRNYGTWSFDMAIYDQGYWLVSRGGSGFDTVRGLNFFGQHTNFVAYLYAPAYWLGAGPAFLYVSQAAVLGAGALPVYLIARDAFEPADDPHVDRVAPSVRIPHEWGAALVALGYLLYAPVGWIAWANYHPEALVITPLLVAWWAARSERPRWYWAALVCALATREDAALAVAMIGIVLAASGALARRRGHTTGRGPHGPRLGLLTAAIGVAYYAFATKVVIPHFNYGAEPFYVPYFYGEWGSTTTGVIRSVVTHPARVWHVATLPDRVDFYRKLFIPLGGLPFLGAPVLAAAAPQMTASVIGSSPYARQILYQYTSVMIAPIVIAAIEGIAFVAARVAPRSRAALRIGLALHLFGCSLVTSTRWSNSPLAPAAVQNATWMSDNPRRTAFDRAVAMVPPAASVSATYTVLPHLAHRRHAYDWPNPFENAYWGNETRAPDGTVVSTFPPPHLASSVAYLVLDNYNIAAADRAMFSALIEPDVGDFEVVFYQQEVIVARRVRGGPVAPPPRRVEGTTEPAAAVASLAG